MTKKEQIKSELEIIREENGGIIRPADVVDYARQNPSTALHASFEWDDGVAAEKFRLQQARSIIRIHVKVIEQAPAKVRAYVSVAQDRMKQGGGYRAIDDVLSDAEMRAQLLSDALSQLASWRRRYATLQELAQVFAAADDVLDERAS